MADCSKTVEFSRELNRLCEIEGYYACNDTCPFGEEEYTCPFDRQITQEDVDIVQKWSDEHPVPNPKTYADDFFEKFPAAHKVSGRPAFCRAKIYGTPCLVDGNVINIHAEDCLSCWNEPLPD